MVTEDVRILEIDSGISDGVAGVDKGLAFSVELDGVGGFVDAVCFVESGFILNLLGDDPHVLLVHVFDVADGAGEWPREGGREQAVDRSAEH